MKNMLAQLRRNIDTLEAILDKAAAHAEEAGYPFANLLTARLFPDQFDLCRQVQTVCDSTKLASARLTGRDAPKHEDRPMDLAELKARLADVRAYLDGLPDDAYDGAATKPVRLSFFPPGKMMHGEDYVAQFVLPNVYFHTTTAYAILRANGVPLGKRDYLTWLHFRDG
jgi:hypothetical protein